MQPVMPKPVIPEHVPAALVKNFPYIFGMTTREEPHRTWAPRIHAEEPDIFFAPHAYPGGTPAWVVRRMDHLREVYFDTDTFSSKDFSPFAKLIGESWINTPVEIDPPNHAKYRKMAKADYSLEQFKAWLVFTGNSPAATLSLSCSDAPRTTVGARGTRGSACLKRNCD